MEAQETQETQETQEAQGRLGIMRRTLRSGFQVGIVVGGRRTLESRVLFFREVLGPIKTRDHTR